MISHAIGARSRECPVTGVRDVRFEFFVIGYLRDEHVIYVRFNGFRLIIIIIIKPLFIKEGST